MNECLNQWVFWHIFIMLLLSMSFSYFMKPSLKSYGQTKFNDDAFLTVVAMVAFGFSTLAKFGWGVIHDYLGFVKCYIIVIIL